MSSTGAEAILKSLKANRIDYLFANPGSDFAPIIEAYANSGISNQIPECITAPHETVCVAMAHGYFLATGQMQAVMVHVNVGLANAAMGLINARADDVPIFMMSGRTPLTEHDREGSRRTPIQYGQEMFDQTALVREAVKWDYELRYAENASDLVSRGTAIALSEPTGSVYMSLPREPLCEQTNNLADEPKQVQASIAHPDPESIAQAAKALAEAQNPLIICSRGDTEGAVARELTLIAEENSIAICEVFATRNILASDHPLNIGPDTAKHLPDADVVLVVDASVAWIEAKAQPSSNAHVIHIGPDPLFARMPLRTYKTSQAIAGNTAATLTALRAALPKQRVAERDALIHQKHQDFRTNMQKLAERGAEGTANKNYVAQSVSKVLGDDGVIFSERGGPVAFFDLDGPNRWFGNTQAGGLGWCLPAALGFQLANKDRLVVCLVGDGSYMFANPVACHQVAAANNLALLTIILNNESWDAVRTSTLEVYPDGNAAKSNVMPMVPLTPTPDYCAIAEASGAWTKRINRAQDIESALAEAISIIRTENRQVLLDIAVSKD